MRGNHKIITQISEPSDSPSRAIAEFLTSSLIDATSESPALAEDRVADDTKTTELKKSPVRWWTSLVPRNHYSLSRRPQLSALSASFIAFILFLPSAYASTNLILGKKSSQLAGNVRTSGKFNSIQKNIAKSRALFATKSKERSFRKTRTYRLESVELIGTTRLTIGQLANNLGLKAGIALNGDFVMSTRARLLSLGLFKSAILVMRKGSEKGLAHLIFDVEDDDGVLGDWALGGSLAVVQSETQAQSASKTTAPLGYRMELIGRNFFTAQHRGATLLDIDAKGVLREGRVAYGMPRFAAEDAQFDAEIAVIDVNQRYLNTLGFGGRGQGLWSSSIDGFGTFQYGAAMYVNTANRFRMPGFPTSVAGPKVAIKKETRLMTFLPGAGYGFGTSVVVAPVQLNHSVIEIDLAKTFALGESRFTLSSEAISIGLKGYGLRSEARYDFPLTINSSSQEKINFYARFRGGVDVIENTNLLGSAAIFGLRYYSSGFIAEFAVQITRAQQQLNPTPLIDPDAKPTEKESQ